MKWIGYLFMIFSLIASVGCTQTVSFVPSEASTSEIEESTHDVASMRRMAMRTSEAAVKVVNPYAGRGSGTYYEIGGHHIVITAAHVVRDTQMAFIEAQEGELTLSMVVYRDEVNDIAIIATPEIESREAMKYRPRSEADLRGTEVLYTGYPANHELFTAYGRVSGLSQNGALLIHSYAWMGASGSSVFDTRGRLVGILYAVDLGSSPYDPYRVLPPHVVEDVVHVAPIWKLNMDEIIEQLDACAEGVCRQ